MKNRIKKFAVHKGSGTRLKEPLLAPVIYFILILLSGLNFSCGKEKSGDTSITADASIRKSVSKVDAVSPYISCGNVKSGKMEVYSYSATDWNSSSAMHWSFAPTTALGFSVTGSTYFDGSTDVKVRYNSAFSGATSVAAIVDNRWAALVVYEGTLARGTKLWGKFWDSNQPLPNWHSAEVLPNGNIVVAGSTGGYVRVYNTLGGNYAEYIIEDAHAVLWDPLYNRLWVNGKIPGAGGVYVVTALIVGGTRTAPTLTEDIAHRSPTPAGGTHDLAPYFPDPNKLLSSDHTGVRIFNKDSSLPTSQRFTSLPGAAYRSSVKGISVQTEGGVLVETRPDGVSSPNYYTSKVEFYNPVTGAAAGSRTRTGAQFYKGKVFTRAYQ